MTFSPSNLSALPQRTRNPMSIVREQNEQRLQDLLPVRRTRMLESPFAWFRGTAAVMAADLATVPDSGLSVLSCGDAHLGNFGYYASPERTLLFDLNDFDEAGVAPWEWDVKRLVASVYLCARENGIEPTRARKLAKKTSKSYQQALCRMDRMNTLDRFYRVIDTDRLAHRLGHRGGEVFAQEAQKARKRTSEQALRKFGVRDEQGRDVLVDQPPLTRHVGEDKDRRALARLWEQYLDSVDAPVRYLFGRYEVVDHVLRVVGVGSVGTRCFIVLLKDPDGSALFLQIKEANASGLETYGERAQSWQETKHRGVPLRSFGNGYRVVAAQRILQSQSDLFLGWASGDRRFHSEYFGGDFYVRQFRDMKGSITLAGLDAEGLESTAGVCAEMLAGAHAQSRGMHDVAQWLRGHDKVHKHLADFARDYGELVVRDYHRACEEWTAEQP